MRKLVTIRKVYDIQPIPEADLIEAVQIDGWRCVCKKGEFKIGDSGIYFEIDSNLNTDLPQFAFLNPIAKKNIDGKFRARIKTRKLRGVVSQGLFLPISAFPDVDFSDNEKDYSEELDVVKYEPPQPASLGGLSKGYFPNFLEKSDEERVQSSPWVINGHTTAPDTLTYEVSLKLNGSSMTVFHNSNTPEDIVGVCSRNLQLKLDQEGNSFINVAKKLNIMEKLADFYAKTNRNIAVQGELIGEGIQSNFEKIVGQDFYVYTVYDIDNHKKLLPNERRKIVEELGLKHVPVYDTNFKLQDHFSNVDEIVAYADGPSMNNKVREGVVFKANEYINGEHFSFKAISNKYLLKYDTDE